LLAYADRYRDALGSLTETLKFPRRIDLVVVERLEGNSTTEFGAPGRKPSADSEPLTPAEERRLATLVRAAWATFDEAADRTRTPLRTGPRGGGRDVERMREHVLEGEVGYLGGLGGKIDLPEGPIDVQFDAVRDAWLEAFRGRVEGSVPDRGPRGAVRWPPRYAIRRSAWHALDHAWEIEDRRT
jgi:hypothetical protein